VPEGDTIHKIAGFLAPRLRSRRLARVEMADSATASRCMGRLVRGVTARGKHLFIELDDDTALRSHLGMYGTWHFYAPGEDWRKPVSQASLVLATEDAVYVCFNAREVELVRAPSVRERVLGMRLGPDLLIEDGSLDVIVRRAREILERDTLLADVLLDQRVASGIGNVYKSEVLFLEHRSPLTRLGDIGNTGLERCYATAAGLLRRNLGGGPRITRFEKDGAGRLWVYGRRGQPCLRCDGRIESARLGRDHRSTYWCNKCQRNPGARGP
jgi:endonuclease-8